MVEQDNTTSLNRRRNTRQSYQLFVAYKKFLQEKKRQNDENSRLIFIVNYLEKINFELYGMDGKEQLIAELEKYYNENEILI
ncbi:hypothetical protein LF296_07830 [Acinetobacter vivianii]|jgi:hypothetical protein|uniref:Uncharacterized protein n=1 Tax=Acinetobacter vivianii TaxID=1776742 RepID=N8W8R0_9GAMM|nr:MULTISPECIES: hypothetical protein [Acinetobacter]ENU91309.1 hypothetical protein F971_02401 [Acinetobacter vivianii]ENX22286.1 hypothetical protein F892_01528 [Acinetobacter vivianii]KHF77664.1 hypothetical protein PJ15_0719 [Acinetobacter sp. neg1]MBJ8481792.1 hypothetical protein [Acinetobacter vivianii]MEB6478677.1 hypothetical protein [Acinetobacter vivianii]